MEQQVGDGRCLSQEKPGERPRSCAIQDGMRAQQEASSEGWRSHGRARWESLLVWGEHGEGDPAKQCCQRRKDPGVSLPPHLASRLGCPTERNQTGARVGQQWCNCLEFFPSLFFCLRVGRERGRLKKRRKAKGPSRPSQLRLAGPQCEWMRRVRVLGGCVVCCVCVRPGVPEKTVSVVQKQVRARSGSILALGRTQETN